MKSKELLNLCEISFGSLTGIDSFDKYILDPEYAISKNIHVDLIHMSPDQYIDLVYIDVKLDFPNMTRDELIKSRDDKEIKNNLSSLSNSNVPALGYDDNYFFQEGLHRAIVAKEEGINIIPVYIRYKNTSELPKELLVLIK